MSRALRYASVKPGVTLSANSEHELAHRHAVSLYAANAVYSMIPKNACSTMRLSIALANGAISSPAEWRWIHANNSTFRPTLRELATAQYSFAVLRCPYARLVSCFLDKIVSRSRDAWDFHELINEAVPMAKLTFRRFCAEMAWPAVKHANIHWRPQVDFLVYRNYDDLFCVEDFATASTVLRDKTGLAVVDSRPLVRHDSSHYRTLPEVKSFADTEVWQIESIMLNGLRPHPASFYDDELREVAWNAYLEDHKLYNCLFSGHGLFDRPSPRAALAAG